MGRIRFNFYATIVVVFISVLSYIANDYRIITITNIIRTNNQRQESVSRYVRLSSTTESTDTVPDDKDIQKWLIDSLGCRHIRTLDLADSLVNRYGLLSKCKRDFLLVFGPPNDIDSVQNRLVLIYYINSVCRSDMIIDKADKCWINFVFEDDTLVSSPTFYVVE